jgi:hypothetical protein
MAVDCNDVSVEDRIAMETGKCKICDETLNVLELYGSGMCGFCEREENDRRKQVRDSVDRYNRLLGIIEELLRERRTS